MTSAFQLVFPIFEHVFYDNVFSFMYMSILPKF